MGSKLPISRAFRILFPWHQITVVERVAGEVARECRGELWRKVQSRAADMSVAEIRGYVRARAAALVAAEVQRPVASAPLEPALRTAIAERAVEQLVNLVVRDVLCGERAAARNLAA
jgi:hypothetical protein